MSPTKLSVWQKLTEVHVNPTNGKCTTLPLLNLRNQYTRNFHLAWLGFWVAFLSWFAFSPLIPEAVKSDLKLTNAQIGNSNIVSLLSTLFVRVVVGPLVDRYGPRRVMAGILVLGAIPSGLAGTIKNANGLYIVRFFIGILGGTFVPNQAWTSAFFDTGVVGRANALSGGWGNSGGGFTFFIMLAVYDRLIKDGLSQHVAWRAAFAIVPVPILLATAAAMLVLGTDHPLGRWEERHVNLVELQAEPIGRIDGVNEQDTPFAGLDIGSKERPVNVSVDIMQGPISSRGLTMDVATRAVLSPLIWLPSLAYLTTFGFELAVDANLSNILYGIYTSPSFGQTKAGYIAAVYGVQNVYSRPLGGYLGDLIYRRFGATGKKYLTLGLGILQGFLSIALGVYIDRRKDPPRFDDQPISAMWLMLSPKFGLGFVLNRTLMRHFSLMIVQTGIVGGMGNLGGVLFALIFRMQPTPPGKEFWISGIFAIPSDNSSSDEDILSSPPSPYSSNSSLDGELQQSEDREEDRTLPESFPPVPADKTPNKPADSDLQTPDKWVHRNPDLIRLTGKHPFNAEAPLSQLFDAGFLTPSHLHFVRNHGAVPRMDATTLRSWTIQVHGLIANPRSFSLQDLRAHFEVVTLPVTLVCAGNRRKEQNILRKSLGFDWGSAGVSTALWTDVYLADILAFVQPLRGRAKHVIFEGADSLPNGPYGTSQRLSWAASRDRGMLIAWAMNGRALEPDHGFPVRLIIPGQIGGRSVKWLKDIEISEKESSHYLHYFDNRVLPTQLSPEQARAEKHWWYDPSYIIKYAPSVSLLKEIFTQVQVN
ncbi:uncharacterized protein FIBRA_04806 [Fibroporia radiculosa]|uniref:Nitrate reductase [NADPH] n=1 Tax=Fibroporia radiculosa TaxID=599839 RepID=J4GPU7_9APHY|nr:uncharacterized protein FIBRA_04806 [Fibroporia radiculosa]CCM02700.1 predicted protein [Fibroporia radiculosa]